MTFLVLIVLGTIRPDPATGPSASTSDSPVPPAWMRKLAPGEKPPQFVLFSFDGAGSHTHWQRVLPIAERVGAHVTGFLSGIYLLPDARRHEYTGPGHAPGVASIGFGGTVREVRTRVADLNTALEHGHEIGTHYNGHFCHGAEPSGQRWTARQWEAELAQFDAFVSDAARWGLRLTPEDVKGGRTPCLEGKPSQLLPTLAARGMTYDSSQTAEGVAWPTRQFGVWEFATPVIRVPALDHKKVVMMDYNLWYSLNGARDDPSRRAEFTAATLETYRAAYRAAFRGNRAPLVIGSHFNDWAGGAFRDAVERFMAEVCVRPETVCATYQEVIRWLDLQDRDVLDRYRAKPNAQVR